MSRIEKSSKNIMFGVMQQIITLLLTFVTRTIFIRYLSIELLGVNSLFSNILTVLSIADLGFGTAILYSMYKPIAENDENKICALMNFYKQIYTTVAIAVLVCGLMILPFLSYLIKENNIEHIHFYYVLFLIDTVVSYLLAYKVNIINADQKNYIIKKYTIFFNTIKAILQCFLIIIFKSFPLYIIVQILYTLSINLYGAFIAHKMYPYINKKIKLEKEEKKEILENVKSIFIYKIGGVILNNTDNILISLLIGVTIVGYYTNYSTVITSITGVTTIIFSIVTYSVGNMIVLEAKEYQYIIFKRIEFFCSFIFSIGSICLLVLINDLIKCWIGTNYIIDFNTVIAIVINFYIVGVLNTIVMFRDTTGLFNNLKYLVMVTATLNLIFSIILGKIFGLFGIIIATAISRLLTNFWYEPFMLHKLYFEKSSFNYFIFRIKNIIITLIVSILFLIIFNHFIVNNWVDLILKTIIVSISSLAIISIYYFKSPEFLYYINLIKKILLRKKSNNTFKQNS